jgi:N-acetylglucosaminyldiphosphoundecaprenol N-acetyl-beta-D-mannosaminyltransferase
METTFDFLVPKVPRALRVGTKKMLFGISSSLRIWTDAVGKRVLDSVVAIAIIAASAPVLAFVLGRRMLRGEPIGTLVTITERAGQGNRPFKEFRLSLHEQSGITRLMARVPALLNILRGEMSFVGPRPVQAADGGPHRGMMRWRTETKPGLVCLWWLRKQASISFESEAAADYEYVESRSLAGDLAIMARSILALLLNAGNGEADSTVEILGLPVNNIRMNEAVDQMALLLDETEPSQVCFLNAYCVNVACENKEYKEVIRGSRMNLADGTGIRLAGKMLRRPVKENVNGTDLFPRLCARLSGTGKKIYLLGGKPGVAKGVAAWIQNNFPEVAVAGYRDGFFRPDEESAVVGRIAESKADLLLVALGVPRQDVWIHENLEATQAKLAMGVGGLFDFYSGRIPRAPVWVREIGMEWVFRFVQEPKRLFRRYFAGNFVFIARVLLGKAS